MVDNPCGPLNPAGLLPGDFRTCTSSLSSSICRTLVRLKLRAPVGSGVPWRTVPPHLRVTPEPSVGRFRIRNALEQRLRDVGSVHLVRQRKVEVRYQITRLRSFQPFLTLAQAGAQPSRESVSEDITGWRCLLNRPSGTNSRVLSEVAVISTTMATFRSNDGAWPFL